MIVLKRVEYEIRNIDHLRKLLAHVKETASRVEGVEFNDVYFPKNKNEFLLVMDCVSEEKYLQWRKICPPPAGAKDWHEVFLTKEERYRR